jgi:hypothetical protein
LASASIQDYPKLASTVSGIPRHFGETFASVLRQLQVTCSPDLRIIWQKNKNARKKGILRASRVLLYQTVFLAAGPESAIVRPIDG